MLQRALLLSALLALVLVVGQQSRAVECKALQDQDHESSDAGGSTNPDQNDDPDQEDTDGAQDEAKPAEIRVNPTEYLGEFGYLTKEEAAPENSLAEETFEEAVRNFQRMMGLNETGKIDAQTKEWMSKSRCGNKDIDKEEANSGRNGTYEDPLESSDGWAQEEGNALQEDSSDYEGEQQQQQPGELRAASRSNMTNLERVRRHLRRFRRYALMGSKWPRPTVTYRTVKYTSHTRVKREDWDQTLDKAFKAWSAVAPIKFEKRDKGKVDIEVSFVKGQHQGCDNDLKDKSTVLAHAYPPGKNPINGDIHFNDYHKWTTSLSKDGGLTPVLPVAVHEIGHTLGVDHSHIRKAIMFPMNQGHLDLDADDKKAINTLYGDLKKGAKGTAKPKTGAAGTKRPAGGQPRGSPTKAPPSGKPRSGQPTSEPKTPASRPRGTRKPASAPKSGGGRPPVGGAGGCVGAVCNGGGILVSGGHPGLIPEPNDPVGAGPGIHVGVDNRLVACGGAFFARGPNCRMFFDCTAPYRRLKYCPPGLFWRQSRLWCDFPHNVPECDYEVDATADAPENIYPPQPPLVAVGGGPCVGVACRTRGGSGGTILTQGSGEPDASQDPNNQGEGDNQQSGGGDGQAQGDDQQSDGDQQQGDNGQQQGGEGDSTQGEQAPGPQGDDGAHGEQGDAQGDSADGEQGAPGELKNPSSAAATAAATEAAKKKMM